MKRGVGPSMLIMSLVLCTPALRAQDAMLLQTSTRQRQAYLARATIWKPGGIPTPEQIRLGPDGRSPIAGVETNAEGEVPCVYDHGGAGAPGRTAKFTCRTATGRLLRVKYYDGNTSTGNREVFGELLATRLFWALGFGADAVYPVVVRCQDCPADPNSGKGARASRRYLGIVEAPYEGTIITSTGNADQGWSFGDLRRAITELPHGAERTRQLVEFDALTLLAVFVQHGDRKPSQQRLVCTSALLEMHGERALADADDGGLHVPVLLERHGEEACTSAAVAIQDLGATFGGAGQFTTNVSSKAHLSSWSGTAVFAMRSVRDSHAGAVPRCRGSVTPAMSAGRDAEPNPEIGDAGREFLRGRLAALTPEHLRALFETAHVDEIREPQQWRDRATGRMLTGIDAWVAVFQHKVSEIGSTACPN